MTVSSIVRIKDGETVIRVVRQYFLVYAPKLFLAFLFAAAPFFLMIPLFARGRWGLAAFVASLIVGIVYGLRQCLLWYWNALVITSMRVIDIDQRGFFERIVSEAVYEKMQDVSYRVKGVWGTMLGYGTIVIQTAGTTTNIELAHVRDPKEVHHLITETQARAKSVREEEPPPPAANVWVQRQL